MTDEEYAWQTARQLIDLGAACQKAGSFTAAEPGISARSVYDVSGERLLTSLRERYPSINAELLAACKAARDYVQFCLDDFRDWRPDLVASNPARAEAEHRKTIAGLEEDLAAIDASIAKAEQPP